MENSGKRTLGKDIQAFINLKIPFLKIQFFKFIYRLFCTYKVLIIVIINSIFKKIISYEFPKIFYAGAKKGNLGGPLAKTKKLNKFFPEYNFKFNIVYVQSNFPFLSDKSISLLKRNKIAIVLNQNGVFYPAWFKEDWKKENLKIAKVYHSADYVFWQSNFCKIASDKFLGKRLGEGEVLYNAVDTQKFIPKSKKLRNIFKLLITGNINKQNNYRIYTLLKALQKIIKINKFVHLYIAGYLEDIKYFKHETERLGIKDFVFFLGPYSQENAPEIYQNADAYITVSYQDNCPSAVIEAMSCGLPVLYSSSGGVPELVGENAGIGLNVPHDWEKIHIPEINIIVMGVFEIIEKRQKFSESARERALNLFDINDWIKRHDDLFKKYLYK